MKSIYMARFSALLLCSSLQAEAQFVSNPIGIPFVPGCAAGTSWTKTGTHYTCQAPLPPPPPAQQPTPQPQPTGPTVVSQTTIVVYSDGSGVVGGGNNEELNSWSGSCESTSNVLKTVYSDGSVVYSMGGVVVAITDGSQLLGWVHVPGTCNTNNH
jgi:hypothetical protein